VLPPDDVKLSTGKCPVVGSLPMYPIIYSFYSGLVGHVTFSYNVLLAIFVSPLINYV